MPAAVWLVLAVALCLGELVTLDLVLLMLAAGALAGGGAALVTDALTPQVGVAAVVAAVLLLGVRPVARRHLEVPVLSTGPDRLPGRTAVVVEPVTDGSGQVRIDGELWRARPFAGGPDIAPGVTVVVADVEGATLHVFPQNLQESP